MKNHYIPLRTRKALNEFRKLDKKTIQKIARVSNMTSQVLFTREAYKEAGMPEDLLNYFNSEWRNQKTTDVITGIYGLEVLEAICEAFKLEYRPLFGRGFQACECFVTIEKFCNHE